MNASLGRIKAQLDGPAVDRVGELVKLINKNVSPPSPVTETDVHIRAMYIASGEINSFGGRFPAEELRRLTELLVDSPVLVGHRKDRLPVGRTFHARLTERDGKQWVKSYFYWLCSAQRSEDLKENIDGGIYKECSIGFTYLFPECSVCGRDIRTCRHEPLEQYSEEGATQICHFNYRQIERVLETSLVYRGAVPDTAMSKDLAGGNLDEEESTSPTVIESPAELPLDKTYLVIPNYDSLMVMVTNDDGQVRIRDMQKTSIAGKGIDGLPSESIPIVDDAVGMLIGYRGKERCSAEQLRKYLDGRGSSVSRVELKLLPDPDINFAGTTQCLIRHDYSSAATLPERAGRLMTKAGVKLWPVDSPPPGHPGYVYRPVEKSTSCIGYYRIALPTCGGDALLQLCDRIRVKQYVMRQFHVARFAKGGRFVSDLISEEPHPAPSEAAATISGGIKAVDKIDDAIVLELEGPLEGKFVIHPITINGKKRYLVSRPFESREPDAEES